MAATVKLLTAEDLEKISPEILCELVDGVLIELLPNNEAHAFTEGNLTVLLGSYVRQNRLGRVLTGDAGFILRRNPDTVRGPDIAFIGAEPASPAVRQRGFLEVMPDLAIEIVSPGNTPAEIQARVHDYFEAGVRLVWVVYPERRAVQVIRSLQERVELTEEDTLTGEDVIPGFSCRVSEIFE